MTIRVPNTTPPAARTAAPKGLVKRLNPLARTLHIYLTMLAMIGIMFFSSTGFMMNHPDWFPTTDGDPVVAVATVDPALLKSTDRLPLIECLRKVHHVVGTPDLSFQLTDNPVDIVFSSPASKTDVEIARAGKTTIKVTYHGLAGVLANLHQGQDTGPAWHRVIDATAILLFLASLTGLVLFLALPKRRKIGLAALALGLALPILTYLFLVP